MNKTAKYQLIILLLAVGCAVGLIFVKDNMEWFAILIALAAFIGCFLGLIIGLQGFSFPLYLVLVTLILGLARIYPYYASDLGSILPSLLYSMYFAPAALWGILIATTLRHLIKGYFHKLLNNKN